MNYSVTGFNRDLAKVAHQDEGTRYAIHGVQIDPTRKIAVATDAKCLVVQPVDIEVSEGLAVSVVVPQDALAAANDKVSRLNINGNIESVGKKAVSVFEKMDGHYPKAEDVLPKDSEGHKYLTVGLSATLLMNMAKAMTRDKDNLGLTLHIPIDDGKVAASPILVTAFGGPESIGAIMPIRDNTESTERWFARRNELLKPKTK